MYAERILWMGKLGFERLEILLSSTQLEIGNGVFQTIDENY